MGPETQLRHHNEGPWPLIEVPDWSQFYTQKSLSEGEDASIYQSE
jgi:hypothetical protein